MLRSRIVQGSAECVYRLALLEILGLAGLNEDELESIDFESNLIDWALRPRIITALVSQYSKVLDVLVGDENDDDFLVWQGLDVPNTYGDPDLEPDVEHYCIAILMLEGLVTSAVTANWDGLLEKALGELAPAFSSVGRVVVAPEDFRSPQRRLEVIKFHGCAVRARQDESIYRPLLIARESQIAGWSAQPQNQAMRQHLEVLYTDRLTLMIGLSAQDANLQTVFATAIQHLARPWPTEVPAVVLSEEGLQSYHRNLLRLTYGQSHQGNATAIGESALLGSFGKPTLIALVLSALTDKLAFFLEHALQPVWAQGDRDRLQSDLRHLRDDLAQIADSDRVAFVTRLVELVSFVLTVFRTGRSAAHLHRSYEPLSELPGPQAVHLADFPKSAFGMLGVALSLIARGQQSGNWIVRPGDRNSLESGVVRLIAERRETGVIFVKDSAALVALDLDEEIDVRAGTVLVVMADAIPRATVRAPRPRYGRSGKPEVAPFSVASSLASAASSDDLFEAFKLAGGF